jgi:P27 family predicted phage terminase small subunit
VTRPPDPPDRYDPERQAIWRDAATRLTAGGRPFRADPEVLNTYVEAIRAHRQASAILAQTNVMITRDGKAEENPALAIQRRTAQQVAQTSRALGLHQRTLDMCDQCSDTEAPVERTQTDDGPLWLCGTCRDEITGPAPKRRRTT